MNVNTIGSNVTILPTHSKQNKLNNRNNKFVNDVINLNNSPNAIYNINFRGLNAHPTMLERSEGCLLGGAIGDAFGALIETLNINDIKAKYGKMGLQYIPKKNHIYEITDDTQMSLFTIEGLLKSYLKNKNLDTEPDYSCIYDSYQNWYKTQTIPYDEVENKNGLMGMKDLYQRKLPGITCLNALSYHIPGKVGQKLNNSAGNGGAMRIAPIGILYHKNPELAFTIGMKSAALTHSHPNAYLPAGYLAALIANIINNQNFNEALANTLKILRKYPESENFLKKINSAKNLSNKNLQDEEAINLIGLGATGDEAIAISIYSILKNDGNFKGALATAINHSGDSDTTGAITGNIIGAILGSNKIPRSWKEHIQFSNTLCNYAKILHKISEEKTMSPNINDILYRWSFDKYSSC